MFYVREIDVHRLGDLGEDVLYLDVRSDSEVAAGAIDGATHVPLHLLPLKLADIDRARTTVIYCRTGARSAQACAFLAAQGFDNVYNLRGGIFAWLSAGRSVSRAA